MSTLDTQVGGNHYKDMAIQPLEFCEANRLPFAESCIIKYVCRHEKKGGIEDLEKARHLIDFIIERRYLAKHKQAVTDFLQEISKLN